MSEVQTETQEEVIIAPESDEVETEKVEAEEDKEHKAGTRLQKRIDKLTREKYQLKGELESERRRTAEMAPKITSSQSTPNPGRPDRSAYADDDAYIDAVAEYHADRKISGIKSEEKERESQKEYVGKSKALGKQFEAATANIPGFKEDVADLMDEELPQPLIDFMLDSKKSAEILHYLSKNPDELEEIQGMSERRAIARLGVLEDKVSVGTHKKTSSAPSPINPLGGKAPVSNSLHAGLSTEEWMQRRRASLKKR